MGDLSCIYYTSNHEDPEFEHKIQVSILEVCDLPIISVSQKPIDFGENICVGDVGASGFNCFRQIQIACRAAKTRFVLSLEADCLYPPDYFEFVPERLDTVYRNTNIYVMPHRKDYWHCKSSQTAFQVAGRDFLLERLNFLLKDQPEFNTEMKNFPKEIGHPFLEGWEEFATKDPCFGIKTGQGMRNHTSSSSEKVYKLPLWGKASDVRKEYL